MRRLAHLVQPRQRQQVLDEHAHARGLVLDPAHRLGDVLGLARGAHAEQLGVAADRDQRRAQLVRGVGDEAAQPLLARLARGERVLEPVEHAVQREPEPADLGARVGRLDAVGEVAAGDRRGGVAHAVEREQADAHDDEREAADQRRARRRSRCPRRAAAARASGWWRDIGIAATIVVPPSDVLARARGSRRSSVSTVCGVADRDVRGQRRAWCRSRPGRGSASSMTLPALSRSWPKVSCGAPPPGGGPPRRRRRAGRLAAAPSNWCWSAERSRSSAASRRGRAGTSAGDAYVTAPTSSIPARGQDEHARDEPATQRGDHQRGVRSV